MQLAQLQVNVCGSLLYTTMYQLENDHFPPQTPPACSGLSVVRVRAMPPSAFKADLQTPCLPHMSANAVSALSGSQTNTISDTVLTAIPPAHSRARTSASAADIALQQMG